MTSGLLSKKKHSIIATLLPVISLTMRLREFMCGVRRSLHVHCDVLLSQVLLSQVGSFSVLLCFILYDVTGDRFKLNMSPREHGLMTLSWLSNFCFEILINLTQLKQSL